MAEKLQRSTKQRTVIKNIIRSTKCHPTADWIYQEARKAIPDISLGTVYRNLQVLTNESYIQELNYGKGFSRFDGNPEPHYHFVCEKCGNITDFELENISVVLTEAQKLLSGSINSHRLELYGVCADCLKAELEVKNG